MKTTARIKKLINEKAKALPILDLNGTPVGFADTELFLTEGLRLASRVSLAAGQEQPVKAHVQELLRRRGGGEYAKAYVRTVWEMQAEFFKPTLRMLMNRAGDVRQGFVDGFDNEPPTPEPCS